MAGRWSRIYMRRKARTGMYNGKRVGVVIPAYNAEGLVKEAVEALPGFVDRVYVVDDGSTDGTANEVRCLANSTICLIRHGTNRGPGAAMATGYRAALRERMDVVVKVDGDGQMPCEHVERLVTPIIDGVVDYTKGDRLSCRQHRCGMPRFRLFGNLLLTWLTRVASGYWHLSDSQNGFTAISERALRSISRTELCPYYGYLNDILVRLNAADCGFIDIPMPAKYGDERSQIRLTAYIPRVSFLLLSRWLWRLRAKYAGRSS